MPKAVKIKCGKNGIEVKPDPVSVVPPDSVRWVGNGRFEVNFPSATPFGGKKDHPSQSPSPGVHEADSGPADLAAANHSFKYSVLCKESGERLDPDVRVEEPGFQNQQYALILSGAEARSLLCPDILVYEDDLLGFTLDEDALGRNDFTVSFANPEPVYLPGGKRAKNLRGYGSRNATFLCQVRPAETIRETISYRVEIPSLNLAGEGRITVLPRPGDLAGAE